ncbi:MAG: hypothetical protein RML45_01370 [Acetobacteraceae bacterium]|nr:hypothetical protein [Acetobacteraceae bacterium]
MTSTSSPAVEARRSCAIRRSSSSFHSAADRSTKAMVPGGPNTFQGRSRPWCQDETRSWWKSIDVVAVQVGEEEGVDLRPLRSRLHEALRHA